MISFTDLVSIMLMPKELKYAAIAGGVALFGLIFGWVLFPTILKSQLKKVTQIFFYDYCSRRRK